MYGSVIGVLNRIKQIENKFNPQDTYEQPKISFQQQLDDANKKYQADSSGAAVKAKTDSPTDPKTSEVRAMLSKAAQKYNVDQTLVDSVAKVESNYKQDAVSPVGAVGVMQIMPDTAKDLGINPHNTEENIDGAVRYLKQLLTKYDSKEKALAAYNAGMGTVDKYNGIPPYKETIEYVQKVLGTK